MQAEGPSRKGKLRKKHMKISDITAIDPICIAVKFKLAVFTVPAKALAFSVTLDPCQPTKFKGIEGYPYMWALGT